MVRHCIDVAVGLMAPITLQWQGGERFERALVSIAKQAGGKSVVKVGYLAGATYPDGTPVAQVAAWQEFGTPAAHFPIPPRPTFRIMIKKHQAEWGGQLGAQLRATNYDRKIALGRMGQLMKEELVESLLTADVAPLSPVTLMLRQMRDDDPSLKVTFRTVIEAIGRVRSGDSGATGTRSTRLVDTGVLERAPDFAVVDGS